MKISQFKDCRELPRSQQKEFRTIKNMAIREAEHIQLGEITFEDTQMDDEQVREGRAPKTHWQMVNTYWGLFAAEVHGLWHYPVHCFRPLFSHVGHGAGLDSTRNPITTRSLM